MESHHHGTRYTYTDYCNLPDSERYQLVGGFLIREPAPTTYHQRISGNLFLAMARFVRERNLGEVLVSPVDVCLGTHETYQPDILFIATARLGLIGEKAVTGPPDLVVEVLSPSNAYYDLRHKKRIYQETGVREYWIVDPMERTVEVWILAGGELVLIQSAAGGQQVCSHTLAGFTIPAEEIFLPVGVNTPRT